MIRRPPRSTRTDTLLPYTTLFRSYFRPHRDNTTKGTAHRRFAVTLNLNADEFEGGELRFPEFGPHLYKPPTGGAVVFSCSLLHEAMPVTKGRRYVFLPRWEESRVGKACVSTCKCRWSSYHEKKNK